MIDDPNDPHSLAASPTQIQASSELQAQQGTSSSKRPTYDSEGTDERNPKRRRIATSADDDESGSENDYGPDPCEGLTTQQLDALTKAYQSKGTAAENANIHERENRGTPGSESDYGPDPFEGLTTPQLDALTKAYQSKGTAAGNASIHERENRGTPGSESDYGPDPFEGLTTQQLDALTKTYQSKGTVAENANIHEYEYLRPKLKTLQDKMFDTLLPKNGFSLNPKNQNLASASDRFQAAAEILHVRASEFEHHIISVIDAMPQGLERMKSIQKLSPVLGNFSVGTQGDLARIAEACVQKEGVSTFYESVQAQKFLTIARDHLDWDRQLYHKDFSTLKKNRPLARAAEKELMEEFAIELRERNSIDDQLSQDDFGAIVNRVEHCCSVLKHVSELTKNRAFELRQSAYQLRRIMERLDFAKSPVEKDAIDSEGRDPLEWRGKSQAADVTVAARAGGYLTKEHKPSLSSLTRDNQEEKSSTMLRQELRDAYRERSPRER